MAGHSQFANIKHRKDAQDSKRAKLFTKLAREIMVAAKTGQADPNFNPRLRNAIIAAKRAGMPKDRIDTSVKKGSGDLESENYEEMQYEGYASGGIALIVEALTDNRNRTAADVRSAFNKAGGNMGEIGSVNFMFNRVGLITFPANVASAEAMFEAAVEAGAENAESDNFFHEVTCAPDEFNTVRDALVERFAEPDTARLAWQAKDPQPITLEQATSLQKLIEALEDLDDVQHVEGSFILPDDIASQL
jgi:YebC/PmpR family DNA-binding regulatory protein